MTTNQAYVSQTGRCAQLQAMQPRPAVGILQRPSSMLLAVPCCTVRAFAAMLKTALRCCCTVLLRCNIVLCRAVCPYP
jgi:hypothetical protein